jgi:hypothetical protein
MSPVQCRAHRAGHAIGREHTSAWPRRRQREPGTMEMDLLAGSSSSTTPVGWWWRRMLQRLDGELLRAAVEQRFEPRPASGRQGRALTA